MFCQINIKRMALTFELLSLSNSISVANATVYPPNSSELGYFEIACRGSKNCWAGGLKLGYFFILLPMAALFSSNLSVSCQFSEFLSPLYVQKHSIHHFQGLRVLKTSWRAINIDYLLHAEVNSLIVFPPNWVILSVLLMKSTQIWKIGRIIYQLKLGYFEVPCHR